MRSWKTVTGRLVAFALPMLPIIAMAQGGPGKAPEIPPFPPGFTWPANPQVLQAAIDKKDVPPLREHGWWLWAGLNTTAGSGGESLWRSWPTSTQAFPPSQALTASAGAVHGLRKVTAANSGESAINLPSPVYPPPMIVAGSAASCQTGAASAPSLPDGTRFENNGDIMIADVVYNKDAFDWIGKENLNKANVLTGELHKGQKNIGPFPAQSIVLKHMYWPVRGDGYTALPVWDGPWPGHPGTTDYIGYELWPHVVAVDPTGRAQPGSSVPVQYLYHILKSDKKTPLPTVSATATAAPIGDFYNHRVDTAELGSMDANDRAILNASACWLYNRPFQAGDYLVSIGMHIITKEIPGWTMQSVWWHDKPNEGPFAKDRPDISPAKAPGPWRHYLMTSEYGIQSKPGFLPVAYNPYIELAAAHPVPTNCRDCHSRAAWPSAFNPASPKIKPTSGYLTAKETLPDALLDLPPGSPVFNGILTLDFQWAVSDRAN